eukprot:TRINITY_DN117512_c0_g1_i1.p1 TRINITY_DN117512_c0_g1~~TRINITY_DN117512_c0_g1_i1.p1  ORF type:complete len:205 (-),score=16.05 TRINITY_DN117512_c0_g1_i1:304-918(-)
MTLSLLSDHRLGSGLCWPAGGSYDGPYVRHTFIHVKSGEDSEKEQQPGLVRSASNILDGAPSSWASEDSVSQHISGIARCYGEKVRRTITERSAIASTATNSERTASKTKSPATSASERSSSESGEGCTEANWSAGAAFHELGHCKPCAWHRKPAGCSKGESCDFCHLCDEHALKKRRKERLHWVKGYRGRVRASKGGRRGAAE